MKNKIIRKRTKILNDIIREDEKSAPDPDENRGYPIIGDENLDSRILRRVCDVAAGTADRDKAAVDNYRDTGLWMCDGHHVNDEYSVLCLTTLFEYADPDDPDVMRAVRALDKKIQAAGPSAEKPETGHGAGDYIRSIYYEPELRKLLWDDDNLYEVLRRLLTCGTPRYQPHLTASLEYAWRVIDLYEAAHAAEKNKNNACAG